MKQDINLEELEKAFIKNVFINEENRYYLENINKNYFTVHKKDIEIILDLYKKDKLDIFNLSESGNMEILEIVTEDNLFDTLDVDYLYKELVEKNNKNIIITEIEKIKSNIDNTNSNDLLIELEQLRDKTNNIIKEKKITDVLNTTLENILSPEKEKPLKTYISALDDIIYGINKNNFVVIGARPGCGKTAIALQIAINNLLMEKKVLFISLEMSDEDLCKRIICNQSKQKMKDLYGIAEGKNVEGTMPSLSYAINKINDFNLIIEDSAIEHKQIMHIIKNHIIKNKVDLIIVDYIGLIKSEKTYSREREIAEISRDLKLITRDYNTPIICLTQLNRDGADGEPTTASIRESDSLLNDANKVLLLWQDEDQIPEEKAILKCKIAKNREGKVGTIDLLFDKPLQIIKDLNYFT